jgi:transglutaminase-like putative cysteine protease
MRLHIRHRTVYRYAHPANYSIQTLKLTPRREVPQRTLSWRITAPGRRVEQIDAFGNVSHLVTVEGPHSEVPVTAEGLVDIDGQFAGRMAPDSGLSPLAYVSAGGLTAANEAIAALAREAFGGQVASEAGVRTLMDLVTERVRYRIGTSAVTDTACDAIARGEGVCQDQTHVAIAACRAANVPARYVSGYVFSDGDAHAASHAWVDVWLAGENCWLSCDVTHRTLAGPTLCRLAVGRDYLDAAPIRGVRRGGGREELEVRVEVVGVTEQQ